MKKPSLPLLLFFILLLSLSSCVSVKLDSGKAVRAENIIFQAPPSPFRSIESDTADHAWQSTATGNIIAFTSECQSSHDSSLQVLSTESLSALSGGQTIKEELSTFNSREGLATTAEGRVDGIPVKLSLLVFKKNGCNFTISYSGRSASFESEATHFQEFQKNFKVP